MSNIEETQNLRSNKRLESTVTALILVTLVIIVIVNNGLSIRDYLTRNTWQTTVATVVRINSKTHWLTYQYEVDEKQYIGTRLTLTEDTLSGFDAGRRDQYPENTVLSVYYDPNNPSRAALSLDADFSRWLWLGISCIVIIGLYLMVKQLFSRYLGLISSLLSGKHHD